MNAKEAYENLINSFIMKLKDRVKIWIAQDDSDYASNCFSVEPQNDWFDVQYYPEQIEATIIWNK